jgi:hypothetical protein
MLNQGYKVEQELVWQYSISGGQIPVINGKRVAYTGSLAKTRYLVGKLAE